MADILGKIKICSRCGKQQFFKYIETVVADGGFGDRYAKFEDEEDFGWLWFSQFGDLCPECAREWKLMVRDFIGEEKAKTIAPVWRLEEE